LEIEDGSMSMWMIFALALARSPAGLPMTRSFEARAHGKQNVAILALHVGF